MTEWRFFRVATGYGCAIMCDCCSCFLTTLTSCEVSLAPKDCTALARRHSVAFPNRAVPTPSYYAAHVLRFWGIFLLEAAK